MAAAAGFGIAGLAFQCYSASVKTLTMKLPDGLLAWLDSESKRLNRSKSGLVREILDQHRHRQPQRALEMAADLCGCVRSGVRDLARNKKHLKGFGR